MAKKSVVENIENWNKILTDPINGISGFVRTVEANEEDRIPKECLTKALLKSGSAFTGNGFNLLCTLAKRNKLYLIDPKELDLDILFSIDEKEESVVETCFQCKNLDQLGKWKKEVIKESRMRKYDMFSVCGFDQVLHVIQKENPQLIQGRNIYLK